MDTNETNELSANVAGEPTATSPETQTRPTPDQSWNRRGFLKAAALGAAVTGALLLDRDKAGRLHLGGATALADDLSAYPCTANDIDVGVGTIINQPCCCTQGTFTARIQFPVSNHTSAKRYCVVVHLPDGRSIGPLRDANGSDIVPPNVKDYLMTGELAGFPCNAPGDENGLTCFGQPGTVRGKCAPGTCTTIAFNTSEQAVCPNMSPPRGQCRHQQVCVQGFGVTLACGTCAAPSSNCTVPCAGGLALHAKITAAAVTSGTPFTYKLYNGTVLIETVGPTAATCVNFNAANVTQAGSYTVQACDSRLSPGDGSCGSAVPTGCCRTSEARVVTAETITARLALATGQGTACTNGRLTFQASVDGCQTPVYHWTNATPDSTDPSRAVFEPALSGGALNTACHTVSVRVECGSCSDTASMNVTQCVNSTVNPGPCPLATG